MYGVHMKKTGLSPSSGVVKSKCAEVVKTIVMKVEACVKAAYMSYAGVWLG